MVLTPKGREVLPAETHVVGWGEDIKTTMADGSRGGSGGGGQGRAKLRGKRATRGSSVQFLCDTKNRRPGATIKDL